MIKQLQQIWERAKKSQDPLTQRAFMAFLLLFFLTLLATSTLFKRVWRKAQPSFAKKLMEEPPPTRRELPRIADLGIFSLEIQASHHFRAAELGVSLLCQDAPSAAYLTAHLSEARNQLTLVFLSMTEEDLLSLDGKKRLKLLIAKRLNNWMKQNCVQDVFFPSLLLQ